MQRKPELRPKARRDARREGHSDACRESRSGAGRGACREFRSGECLPRDLLLGKSGPDYLLYVYVNVKYS